MLHSSKVTKNSKSKKRIPCTHCTHWKIRSDHAYFSTLIRIIFSLWVSKSPREHKIINSFSTEILDSPIWEICNNFFLPIDIKCKWRAQTETLIVWQRKGGKEIWSGYLWYVRAQLSYPCPWTEMECISNFNGWNAKVNAYWLL